MKLLNVKGARATYVQGALLNYTVWPGLKKGCCRFSPLTSGKVANLLPASSLSDSEVMSTAINASEQDWSSKLPGGEYKFVNKKAIRARHSPPPCI